MESKEDGQRRDAVLRHMLSRPPQHHKKKPLAASKRKTSPASKGRVRKGKSRT